MNSFTLKLANKLIDFKINNSIYFEEKNKEYLKSKAFDIFKHLFFHENENNKINHFIMCYKIALKSAKEGR